MRHLLATIMMAPLLAACATTGVDTSPPAITVLDEAAESAAIEAVLEAQDAAWNRGDIEGFMASYWNSPDLRFASGGTVHRGFEKTRERYYKTYGTPELMGQLSTTDYEVDFLAPDAAVVYGRWQLTRDGDTPGGLYTLVMRKIDGVWLIVSDTTTSAE